MPQTEPQRLPKGFCRRAVMFQYYCSFVIRLADGSNAGVVMEIIVVASDGVPRSIACLSNTAAI